MGRGLLAMVMLGSATAAWAQPAEIPLRLPSGRTLTVEVMVERADQAMGLMFRPSLPEDRGMLFVHDRLGFHSMWMKNCRFPIDIVWLDEERRVVHVAEAVPICEEEPCPTYSSMQLALFVVELNAGQARREGVERGALLEFELPQLPASASGAAGSRRFLPNTQATSAPSR